MTTFNQNLINEIFQERPELAFLGELGRANLPRNLEDVFRSRTSSFLTQLNQRIGSELVQGNLPNIDPAEFFRGAIQQEQSRLSPEQRGVGTRFFNPRTIFGF